jgi:hypothetical protein
VEDGRQVSTDDGREAPGDGGPLGLHQGVADGEGHPPAGPRRRVQDEAGPSLVGNSRPEVPHVGEGQTLDPELAVEDRPGISQDEQAFASHARGIRFEASQIEADPLRLHAAEGAREGQDAIARIGHVHPQVGDVDREPAGAAHGHVRDPRL